jgi:hypothetical protein
LRLNGGVSYYPYAYGSNDYNPKLLAASSKKPTVWIKRLRFGHSTYNIKLRGASSITCPEQLKREREKAAKAMSLNYGF